MPGNGREPKKVEPKKLASVEQAQMVADHANTAYKLFEVLMNDDRIDDGDVRWRVDSMAGVLCMLSIEIDSVLWMLKNKEEE